MLKAMSVASIIPFIGIKVCKAALRAFWVLVKTFKSLFF